MLLFLIRKNVPSKYGQFHKKQGVILLNFKGFKVQVPIYYSSLLLPVKEGKKELCDLAQVKYSVRLQRNFPPSTTSWGRVSYHSSEGRIFLFPVFILLVCC